MVLGKGPDLLGVGIAMGVLVSLGVTRVMSEQLFGVAPHDPMTLGVAVALVRWSALRLLVPGRRATRVDPMVALRYVARANEHRASRRTEVPSALAGHRHYVRGN